MEFRLTRQAFWGLVFPFLAAMLTAINPAIRIAGGNTHWFDMLYLALVPILLFVGPLSVYQQYKSRIWVDLEGIRRESVPWLAWLGREQVWAARWDEIHQAVIVAPGGEAIVLTLKDGVQRRLPLGGWASAQMGDGPRWTGEAKTDEEIAAYVGEFPFVELLRAHGIECEPPKEADIHASRRATVAIVLGGLLTLGFMLPASDNGLALFWRLAGGLVAGGIAAKWVFGAKRSWAEALVAGMLMGIGVALMSGRVPL